MKKLQKFLQAHFCSLPDDLEQPFLKKVDLVLKFLGITFALLGIGLIFSSLVDYEKGRNEIYALSQNLNASSFLGEEVERVQSDYITQRDQILLKVFFKLFFGLSLVIISFVFNAVLMAEYISFTLPDKIYLRCFANREEKEKKRKFANKN